MRAILVGALLFPAGLAAQSAPYLHRGDDVEGRYNVYRAQLQSFFDSLSVRLKIEAPDQLARTVPPAPVPYGYQILPKILAAQPQGAVASRVVLSSFSWSRTESFLDRDRARLDSVRNRMDFLVHASDSTRRAGYREIVDRYNRLAEGQKFIAGLIQYNRLWQGEVARHPEVYRKFKESQDAALERQQIDDVLSFGYEHFDATLCARADSLSERLKAEIRKLPTPDFARLEHTTPHAWVVTMPVYTDIADSAFVEKFHRVIEDGWHVRDGGDDFSVILDIHWLRPAQLYPQGSVPENGAHIGVQSHLARFPAGGMILTTGGNTIYATGRSIVLGPHAIAPGALVHEFGHMLGFRDNYFRSYEDRGGDGYEIVEVILDRGEAVATPENDGARREHFEQIIRERNR